MKSVADLPAPLLELAGYLGPLVVVVSLVYAATRFEEWVLIRRHALRAALSIAALLGGTWAIIGLLALEIETYWYVAVGVLGLVLTGSRQGIAGFVAALRFLTIVPWPVRRPVTEADLGHAVAYLPAVGLVIGLLLAGVDRLAAVLLAPAVTGVLVLVVWALVTGALHLDGFLDSCDAWFGSRSVEERLRILRDEHVGAFAVIGGTLLVLLKYAAILAMPRPSLALLLAPVLGRWGVVLAIAWFPYARAAGSGSAMKEHAGWRQFVWASLFAVGLAFFVAGAVGLAASLATVGIVWLVGWSARHRFGGLTGDVYGALIELIEALALVLLGASG